MLEYLQISLPKDFDKWHFNKKERFIKFLHERWRQSKNEN